MPRPDMEMTKPSEPLGSFGTLGELLIGVVHAIETYGEETRIFGYNEVSGIVLHVHFPDGAFPHITFTQNESGGLCK
jgi:hypothetical protein